MPTVPKRDTPVQYDIPQPVDPKYLAMSAEIMRKQVAERIENPKDMSPYLLEAFRHTGMELLRGEILRSMGIDYTPTFMEPTKKNPNFYKDAPVEAENKRWKNERRRDAKGFKELEEDMEQNLANPNEVDRADVSRHPRKKFGI